MKKIIQNANFIGMCLALFAFVVYLHTLAPSVDFIDSGELATVAATLGIAHPTGYPLFTLLGWVFAHLPLGFRTIYQLNLMSAVLCSIAVLCFFKLFLFLLTESFSALSGKIGKAKQDDRVNRPQTEHVLAAASGALVLAFSQTYWLQAVSIEVYSLHILLLSSTLLCFCQAISDKSKAGASPESRMSWYAFALVLGLSFTNHMTTILLAPGFLYLYFATHDYSKDSWKKILQASIPFLVGFSVYLYLPFRALQHPLLNWGDTATFEKFWWHFSGKQYRVWIFSSFESAEKQLRYFIDSFPAEFAYLPVIFGVIGLFYLFQRSRILLVFTVVLFLSCVFYSINYDIHDIDSYFLLAYIVTALWIAFGVSVVLRKIKNYYTATVICLVAVGISLYVNFDSVDESKNFTVEDYTDNMFTSLEPNALVLSYQWDYFVSASYYYQLVESLRPDVVVVDKELLRRSWYIKQLEYRYPWLIEHSRTQVDAFLQELYKFEHDLPYNPAVIQARFEAMILSFLERSYSGRPVYVTHEIEPEFTRGFQRIPSGLAFRLSRDTTLQPIKPIEFTFREFPKNSKYIEVVKTMYASSYTNQAIFLGTFGDRSGAVEFLQKALAIKPDFANAKNLLRRFQPQH